MSNANINLTTLTANTVLASTFSQVSYMTSEQLKTYTPPAGFIAIEDKTNVATGFSAVTFVNKTTGQVVIAYRGSDGPGEAVGVAQYSASNGVWDPQFTDATNYAKQAQAAALVAINKDRLANKLDPLQLQDIAPLITGHSLGGLLGQVVSKMFGWPAEVFDSLGGGKLVYTTDPDTGKQVFKPEFAAQAKALGLVDANGNVIDRDVSGIITNYAVSLASSSGTQLGSTVDIPALGTMGGMPTIAVLAAVLFNPVIGGAALFAGDQFLGKHKVTAIEQAMYGLAALKPLVANEGELRPQNMTLAQATGQSVLEGSSNPNVVALVNAQNQVVAYVEITGSTPQIVVARGINAGTSLSLGRAGTAEDAPIEIIQTNPDRSQRTLSQEDLLGQLKAKGQDVISSQVFDDGSRIETSISANNLQTVRTFDDEGTLTLATTYSTSADGEAWTRQEFDAKGNITEIQTAVYDAKKGWTEVDVYKNGELLAHTVVEGKASQAQLDRALALSEQIGKATSLGDAANNNSDAGDSLLETLGIVKDPASSLNTNAVIKNSELTLNFVDANYSGSNVTSTPVFSTLADYSKWLVGRGTQVSVRNDIEADPSLLGLQDGALTLALARQNPNPVNVMRALQSVVLAGGVLSESFKQSVADQLGTNTANVNAWVAGGGAAITSFLVAMDKPTVTNVSSAALSMINAGITFTPSLQQTFADKLGVTSVQFGQMLAYGGAGLAVASVLKDPTPQNIVGATQHVTGMLGKMQGSASLQDLSYTLGNATAVFSVYNFAKNPNKQTAVSAMLSVAMRIPSLAPYAVPLAAALTIGEMIIPGFTDKAVNALVHDIPGFAFDVQKNIIKVEVSLLKGTLNLAGSVVETVGGVVNSVGNVVANTVSSAVNTGTNVVKSVWKKFTPLVVNLADDPVHTTTLSNKSPLFDMSGDGVKERTGWITADEGFLVRDLNGNGKIDSINEMFSERTSTTANTAFGALAELDSNKDGVIDKNDAMWGTLKIWVDKNSDGDSQANELYTLAQLGIASIKLNPTKNFAYDNGNIIGDKSTFTYTDGRVGEIADAIFTTQAASNTQNVAQTVITQDSTTVRLSNGQTMRVLDVHGKTFVLGSASEGVNIVTSTGGNTLTAADDANGLILMGETGDNLNAGKGHAVTLVSNGGAKLVGNAEDNLYVVSQTTDVIVEAANAGVDSVRSSASYTLSANLENLTLTGTSAINGTGNALNNILIGNSAANVLDCGAGNDTLDGGAGADTLRGGVGDDTYIIDNVGDMVIEDVGEDVDSVQTSVSYTLSANVENLTLTGASAIDGKGNAKNNMLIGNSASNVLDGGAGVDTLKGGLGDDTYVVDRTTDTIVENLNEGTDTVQSSVSYSLASVANLENLTLTGASAIDGTGNVRSNMLIGNSASNVLDGGAGNDILDGGAGVDTLKGGLGDETYIIDNVDDVVVENAGEGVDSVQTSVSYRLSANVENLMLMGTSAINGTGNSLNNVLTGNAGRNTLNGSAGADRLMGLAGYDTYIVDNVGDVVVENVNEGADTVYASVSYTLAANVEDLYLQGCYAINATGNELANHLYGSGVSNVLDGGAGNDYLDGGQGNDTYVFGRGSGQDCVTDWDSAAGNVDTVLLGVGISSADVVVNRYGYSLYLSIAGTKDQLTLDCWFICDGYRIEQVRFADGTLWGTNTLIVKANAAPTGGVNISGTATQNQTLTASHTLADEDGLGTISWQWLADGQVISGATGSTLTLMQAQVGKAITVRASYTDGYGTAEAVSSAATAKVTNVNDAPTGSVTISGTATHNQTLTASHTLADADGMGTISWQWLADGQTISGTTSSTLVLGQAQVGKAITARASYTDSYGTAESVSSLATAAVQAVASGDVADSANTTVNLRVGDVCNESIATAGDHDWFRITLQAGIAYKFDQFKQAGSTIDSYLRLRDAAGNQLTYDDDSGGNLNSMLMYTPTTSGTYYLDAGGYANSSTGAYSVRVATVAVQAVTSDVADNANTTVNLRVSDVYNESIATAGDHDWFRVSLQAGTTYQFDQFKQSGSNIDSYLRLRDAAGNQLTYDDDSGGNLNSMLVYKATTSGTYYLDAGGYANNSTGAYTICISLRDVVSAGDNFLYGSLGADRMAGLAGNDTYVVNNAGDVVVENVNEGNDTVNASVSYTLTANVEYLTLTGSAAINGTGNELGNTINGNYAANELDGGAGNDYLNGGQGNDTYVFGRGLGQDCVYDYDSTVGNTDVLSFVTGIATNQLWFKRAGSDLEVNIIGGADKTTIQGWYLSSNNQIEQIKAAGKTLLNTDVEKLVQAMASFSAPASGQTTLSTNYQTALAPVIAANWR